MPLGGKYFYSVVSFFVERDYFSVALRIGFW